MPRRILLLLIAACGLLTVTHATSIITGPEPQILKAVKGKKSHTYLPGIYLRIVSGKGKEEKKTVMGLLKSVSNDSLQIETIKRHKKNIETLAVADIVSIQKLHKKGRRGWKIIMGVLAALTIAGIIYLESSVAAVLFLAAPVVALFTLVPYLLANFLSDILSKKSINKGWSFNAADN